MSEERPVYVSIVETPEGCFLRISRPGQNVEDIPLTIERRADLAAACALSLQSEIQRAASRRAARLSDWHARDAVAS